MNQRALRRSFFAPKYEVFIFCFQSYRFKNESNSLSELLDNCLNALAGILENGIE